MNVFSDCRGTPHAGIFTMKNSIIQIIEL